MDQSGYNPQELMVVNAARLLKDHDVVFVGVASPTRLQPGDAQHAPNLQMIYGDGAQPCLPLSIGDLTLVTGATAVCSMYDIFALPAARQCGCRLLAAPRLTSSGISTQRSSRIRTS